MHLVVASLQVVVCTFRHAVVNGMPSVTPPANANLLSTAEIENIVASYPEVFTDEPPFDGSRVELDVEVIPYEGDIPYCGRCSATVHLK
jgi:hypothetical protein